MKKAPSSFQTQGRGMTSAPTPINLSVADLLDQPLVLARMFATVLLLIIASKWADGHHC